MKILMEKILRFWVDCEYHQIKHKRVGRSKSQQIAAILQEYEKAGEAMRYLDANGRVAWKASPAMLAKLADAEREVADDFADD